MRIEASPEVGRGGVVRALEAVDALASTSPQRSLEAEWIKNRLARKRSALVRRKRSAADRQQQRQQQQQQQQALVQVDRDDDDKTQVCTVSKTGGGVCLRLAVLCCAVLCCTQAR